MACLALLGLACESAKEPYRPERDLSSLQDAYDHPTAIIEADQLDSVVREVLPRVGALQFVDRLTFLTESLAEAKLAFEAEGFDFAKGIALNGSVGVTVACPGPLPDADPLNQPPQSANGRFTLRTPVENSELGPGADGQAERCLFNSDQVPLPPWLEEEGAVDSRAVRLDGPVSVDFGVTVKLGEPLELRPLFVVHGELAVEGLPTLTNIDFRFPTPLRIETRVVLPDLGSVVVFSENFQLGLMEKRGVWLCNFGESQLCEPQF